MASRLGDPKALAESLNWLGNWYLNAEDPPAAIAHHQEAQEIFEGAGDRRGLATTLDLLGGDITAMVEYYDRAIPLFEMDDQVNLASSLTGRAHANCSAYTSLTLAPSTAPIQSRQDLEEAMRIVRAIGSSAGETWVFSSVAQLSIVQDRYGQALEAARNGLDVAAQIGHREGMAASQCVLGTLYLKRRGSNSNQRWPWQKNCVPGS